MPVEIRLFLPVRGGALSEITFRFPRIVGSILGLEDDAAILKADQSMEYSFRYLDRRTVSAGTKNKFSSLMPMIIVEFLSDGTTADDHGLGSLRMPMNRNYCVTHQNIEHPLGGISGRSPQIIIHPATRGAFSLFLDTVE